MSEQNKIKEFIQVKLEHDLLLKSTPTKEDFKEYIYSLLSLKLKLLELKK